MLEESSETLIAWYHPEKRYPLPKCRLLWKLAWYVQEKAGELLVDVEDYKFFLLKRIFRSLA